jgi:hypothetical protein
LQRRVGEQRVFGCNRTGRAHQPATVTHPRPRASPRLVTVTIGCAVSAASMTIEQNSPCAGQPLPGAACLGSSVDCVELYRQSCSPATSLIQNLMTQGGCKHTLCPHRMCQRTTRWQHNRLQQDVTLPQPQRQGVVAEHATARTQDMATLP